MARWIHIAAAKDCPSGAGLECLVEGQIVALFNVDGIYYALDGICPHQGGPLAKGCVAGTTVSCPWHGWQFDLTSGQHRGSQSLKQRRYEVREERGEVLIDMEGGG